MKSIACPGLPGVLAVWGEQAFPIVPIPIQGGFGVVAAGASFGEGRVIALAHGSYLGKESLEAGDTRRFLVQSIGWLTRNKRQLKVLAPDSNELVKELLGDSVTTESDWSRLSTSDLLVCSASSIPSEKVGEVQAFVRAGGGLLIADTGWGWAQLNPNKSLKSDHPGQQVLLPMGLGFTTLTSSTSREPISVTAEIDRAALTGPTALELIRNASPSKQDAKSPLLASAASALLAAADYAPAESTFSKSLQPLLSNVPLATPTSPLDVTNAMGRVAVVLSVRDQWTRPPEEVTAYPGSNAFPGAVPAEAARVARVFTMDTEAAGWQSTGLYAAPGEMITLKAPAGISSGLRVRIGAHTDSIEHLPTWKRPPVISHDWPIRSGENKIASPFGGAIYIDITKPSKKPASIEISGAVEAPMFVLGQTSVEDWKSRLRSNPAPWAEFVVPNRVILTFRSDSIREMDDPTPILEHWKKVLEAMSDLAGIPHHRVKPERIVTDVQISAGYMHSGYPIMTHLDVSQSIVDLAKLKTVAGGWGFYHELGHNHQKPEWTFAGTGEVTNNVFVHYVLETVCGLTPEQATTRALGKESERLRQAQLADRDFARWQREPFLALAMYAQLHTAFGWQPFRDAFAAYHKIPANQRPRTEQQKRDLWLITISKATGRNLSAFFTAWGVPTSAEAQKSLADLPAWLPAEMSSPK